MIEKIQIKDVASYDTLGVEINLKKVNYIYGGNGTGKTTISELLRNNDKQDFSSCNIKLAQGTSEFDMFVYNKNFVDENFNVQNEIKGIFTLGKESSDIVEKIDKKTEDKKKHQMRIDSLENNIDEKQNQLKTFKESFEDHCWDLKQKYDVSFKEAFKGLRNSREKFMKRCLTEAENNNSNLHTFEELNKRVESVFNSSQDKNELISKVQYDNTLEEKAIYQTKIIGKSDIDIAGLISEHNISDWVQQGHKHLEDTNGICPFCQQGLPTNFEDKLNEYFDQTYSEQILNLNTSIDEYKKDTSEFFERHNYLITDDIPFIEKEKLLSIFEIMNSIFRENIQLLEQKREEPSRNIHLNSIMKYIEQINLKIKQANEEITNYNSVIDNIKEEKQWLIKDIWRFLVEENKSNYENYISNFRRENKAIKGMKQSRGKQEDYRKALDNKVIELQNKLTSVLPSIDEINEILKSFGFTNFSLAESEEEGNYKIVRENGDDANETLSEGEKTFITFLYFYQLINGSNNQDKVGTERVIVIDDPISSLDSNILFMVSNLINQLKRKIRDNDSIFKQLIILTHNVYFHKEISFNNRGGNQKFHDESFWILRKANDFSFINEYEENPIKNSYELLWKELKENTNSITTPNIMRRILENYFKFFGDINIHEIIESFPASEKIACNTLLSWAHDGSHHMNDDLYIDNNQEINQTYYDVFRRIFINSNHGAHFNMMMRDFEVWDDEDYVSDENVHEHFDGEDQVAASRE